MGKKMRLISLDEALKATHREIYWTESQQAAVRSFLMKQPIVDAVPVRCKGCRYASSDITACTVKFDQDGEPLTVTPMYYCADGKPRRDGRKS